MVITKDDKKQALKLVIKTLEDTITLAIDEELDSAGIFDMIIVLVNEMKKEIDNIVKTVEQKNKAPIISGGTNEIN